MVKIVFTYEVLKEKQEEYLKTTRDKIKPFWESHGCESYTVWLSPESTTRFIKEMVFKDDAAMEISMKQAEAEPIKKLFYEFATNTTRVTYRQTV